MKTTIKKTPPKPGIVVKNCNFTASPTVEHLECVTELANAAYANAIAIQKIADMVKTPDTMVRIGS